SGAAIANTRSTGWPSCARKSTGADSRRNAATGSLQMAARQCGMATPRPMPVLPTASRPRRPSAIAWVQSGEPLLSSRAAASSTWSRPPGSTSCTMRSAASRSVYGMPRARSRSAELAVADGVPAAAVLVDHLLLLLHQHAVELVGQEIDRGVHVG